MAELRTGGACALPQCSLVSVPFPSSPGRCCSSSSSPLERFGDVEQQGLRFNARRFKHQSERMIRTRLPAVAAAGSTSENDVEVGTRKFPGTAKIRKKGDNVVFVAGATGKVGSRTVKELLKLGLQVRAGVRDVEKAKSVLEESIQLSANGNPSPFVKMLSYLGFKQEDRLEFVNCDLENAEEIETALGNAGVVVCAVGASEKEVLDVTGPYRIDYQGTKNLITAATNSKVRHFVLVTSLGTTKFGWPAAVLNLFWGVLVWKAKAEKALVDSGLVYTIVRPGGMERPTDSYKETHNLRLGAKDAFTGGQISRLQVAELLACIASNLELSENKILEAIAETSAPRRPIIELLEEIPSQTEDEGKEKDKGTLKVTTKKNKAGSERPSKRAEEDQKAEAALRKAENDRKERELKQQQAEEEAKSKAIEARKNQELREKIATELATLKKQEEAAVAEVEKLQKKRIELTEKAKAAAAAAAKAEALAKALLGAAKQGKLLSEDDKQKVVSAAEATKTSSKDAPKTTNAQQELKAKITPEPKPRKASIVPPKPVKVAEEVKKVAEPETKKEPETSNSSSKPAKTSVTKVDEPETPKKSSSSSTSATKTKPDIAIAKPTSKQEPPAETPVQASSQESEKPKQIKAEVGIDKPEQSSTESKPAAAKNEKVESKEKESKLGEKDSKADGALEEVEKEKPSIAESSKPFRWFWQQPEVESNVVDETAMRSSEEEKPAARPLSPYYRYPDLKPPPSPRPPSFDKVELTSNSEKTVDSQEALPKPNTVFRWPWQKEEKPESDADVPDVAASPSSSLDSKTSAPSNTPTLKESVPEVPPSEQKKEDKVIATKTQKRENVPAKDEEKQEKQVEATASLPEIPPKKQEKKVDDKAVSAEFDSDAAKERELAALAKARAANAFVWPWSSSSSAEETKDVDKQKDKVEEKVVEDVGKSTNSKPLSPFGRYADLKPPSTPSPRPPQKPPTAPSPRPPKVVSEKVPTAESKTTEVSTFEKSPELQPSEAVKSREEAAVAKAKAALAWPWRQDSNSDGAAAVNKEQSSNATGASTPAVTSSISAPAPVSRPLSPYTRYADLKPPTSPTPAPPRITTAAAQDVEKASKRPPEAASSSAVDEAAEEARARAEAALEKARASIKWTWS